MRAEEFNGSLKSFANICRMVGNDPKDNISDFIQKEGGNEMNITILDTNYQLTIGDILIEQNGKYKIINGNLPE